MLRRDWEAAKDGVMRDALRAKFTQHANLRALLVGTGDALLMVLEARARCVGSASATPPGSARPRDAATRPDALDASAPVLQHQRLESVAHPAVGGPVAA